MPLSAPDLQKHSGRTGGWEEWSTLPGGLAGSNHFAPGYRVPRPQTLRPRPPALSQRIRIMARSSPSETGPRRLTSGRSDPEELRKPQVLEIATVWRFPGGGAGLGWRGRAAGGALHGLWAGLYWLGRTTPATRLRVLRLRPWSNSTAPPLRFGSESRPMRPRLQSPDPVAPRSLP